MKVILNKDLNPLGEEGDIKEVAKGYARNYLFPRGIALPYTEKTVKLFEARREEIEARKASKRQDASGLKEKLEALELVLSMPAGANGKLYGAVTSQTVAEELAKQGFPTERKKVELPGNTFKSVGKYKVTVKLYESASAEVNVTVEAQAVKTETKEQPARRDRRRHQAGPGGAATAEGVSTETSAVQGAAAESVPPETSAGEGAGVSASDDGTATVVPATDASGESVPPVKAGTEQN
ncbi:MAG: 50S ribosomal protein L9 [Spirochaetaceae bacterium]|jgi:large subunit ribosomal protein L9|nr:50S ribosomal protein L9 [Spirochaetaceae bacterium]